jgi:hypothetical protein
MIEHLFRLFFYIVFSVLVGLLPVIVTWFFELFFAGYENVKRDYLRDFYWEGAFLCLGPAIVGGLCAELTVTKLLLDDHVLSAISLTVLGVVVFVSYQTYSHMMAQRAAAIERGQDLQDGPMLTMIKEISDAILISSAVFAFSVTAVVYGAS